jgi:hypothetical protein
MFRTYKVRKYANQPLMQNMKDKNFLIRPILNSGIIKNKKTECVLESCSAYETKSLTQLTISMSRKLTLQRKA